MSEPKHEMIHAYTPTDEGTTIRLRGYGDDGESWKEAVEVVDGDYDDDEAHVTTLCEGVGLEPGRIYNQTIQPYLDENVEEEE